MNATLKPLVLALSLAFISTANHASVIAATFSGSLDLFDNSTSPPTPQTETSIADSAALPSIGSFAHQAFYSGNTVANNYLLAASVDGLVNGQTAASWLTYNAVYENTGSAAVNVGFNFRVAGSLGTTGSSTLQSDAAIRVKVNGVTLWESMATLIGDTLITSGSSLSYSCVNGVDPLIATTTTCSFGSLTNSLVLGVLSAGQSLTLSYELSTQTQSNGEVDGGAFAFLADPNPRDQDGYAGLSLRFSETAAEEPPAGVPEPTGLALVALGTGLIAARRRKAA